MDKMNPACVEKNRILMNICISGHVIEVVQTE